MYFVGIDISKYKHDCCIINGMQEIIARFSFTNDRHGFTELEAYLNSVPNPDDEMRIGFEATSHYALNLKLFLEESHYSFMEFNPILLLYFEEFRHCETDEEYLKEFNEKYHYLMQCLLDSFPDIRWRLKENEKTEKIEMAAEVQSVFDIAWYSFARLVADVAPPVDEDLDYMFSQGSILTCMACGQYFVRHSSRQRYCNNPNCQAERNNRKARAYYERKKITE